MPSEEAWAGDPQETQGSGVEWLRASEGWVLGDCSQNGRRVLGIATQSPRADTLNGHS